MKKYSILIVTEEYDHHADIILQTLREMGHDAVRVHVADIPLQTSLSLSYDGASWKNILHTRRYMIPLEEVRSIWWRRPARPQLPEGLTPQEEAFAYSEVTNTLTNLWELLEHSCYWISFPTRIRKASYKISQLQTAKSLGLEIPRFLASNDADQVQQFYELCNHQMIYKAIAIPMPRTLLSGSSSVDIQRYARNHPEEASDHINMIFTTPIREQDLDLLSTLRNTPGYFQEYVPKRIELRVTVIGNDVFTVELHSQEHESTRFDWRSPADGVETPTYEHILPVEIAEQCLALTRAYGLNFSTSDFIVTPDGRYVFLEMNPNGQWYWMQQRVPELHMREAMAACLIRGSNA